MCTDDFSPRRKFHTFTEPNLYKHSYNTSGESNKYWADLQIHLFVPPPLKQDEPEAASEDRLQVFRENYFLPIKVPKQRAERPR